MCFDPQTQAWRVFDGSLAPKLREKRREADSALRGRLTGLLEALAGDRRPTPCPAAGAAVGIIAGRARFALSAIALK